ncbi:hypothetical protein ACXJY6_19400 [Vibrio sp. RC27]
MLSIIKDIFVPTKDYAGRRIDDVIHGLAARTNTDALAWSYLKDESAYENTVTGMRIYPHEVTKYAA